MVKKDKSGTKSSNNISNSISNNVTQTTTRKVLKKIQVGNKGNETLGASKKSNGKGQDKSLIANNERQSQYEVVEAKHRLNSEPGNDGGQQLREALIFAEIIGRPRCRSRVNRGNRRSYGD